MSDNPEVSESSEMVFTASYIIYPEPIDPEEAKFLEDDIKEERERAKEYTIITKRCCFFHMHEALIGYILNTYGPNITFEILGISAVGPFTDLGEDEEDDDGDEGGDEGKNDPIMPPDDGVMLSEKDKKALRNLEDLNFFKGGKFKN